MKKFSRIILAAMLVIATLVTSALPAFAAGVETWSAIEGPQEKIRVTNTNTTPVKTIGRDGGKLSIVCGFSNCRGDSCSDTEPTSYPPVRVTVKILSYPSGDVLGEGFADEGGIQMLTVTTNRELSQGEKVQIFFDVSSQYNPPGAYRKAHIRYYYSFER